MKQTWENGQNPSFKHDLELFEIIWNFASTRCYALLQAVIVCNFKENEWINLDKICLGKSGSANH